MSHAAYRIYIAVLIVIMTVIPFTWGAIDSIAQPAVVAALVDAGRGSVLTLGAGVLLGAAVLLGTLRGPVVGKPFEISVQVARPTTRSISLRPVLLRNALVVIVAFLYLATILLVGLWRGAGLAGNQVGSAAIGVTSGAVILVLGWLAGQARGQHAWVLAVAVVALGAIPIPASMLVWVLAGLAIGAVVSTPRLLNALFGPAVIAQSQGWHAAWSSLYVGDSVGAFAVYQAVPKRGRYWRAFAGGTAWWRVFRADLVGAARMPARLIGSCVGLIVGTAAVLLATVISGSGAFASGAAGAVLLYLALGPVTTRFKFVSDLHKSPALFRLSTPKMYALHAIFPTFFALVVAGAVGAVFFVAFPSFGTPSLAVICAVILVLILRGFNSAKGQLPAALLAPVDSPMGDFSSLNVLIWQADAVLLAALVGAMAPNFGSVVSQVLAWIFLALGILWLWRRRIVRG